MLEAAKKERDKVKSHGFTAGGGGDFNPFGPEALMKVMANPKFKEYFKDPNFSNMINMCMQNPQMFMMMMQ